MCCRNVTFSCTNACCSQPSDRDFSLFLLLLSYRYTNESAHTTGISKPEMYKGWFDVEPEEFYRFLALLMYMGILPAPSVERFYSAKSLYNGLWARAFMEKKRFQQLLSFLKVSNREREDPKNKLAKVTFLLEFIQRRCQNLFQPGRNLAIDERMVRNKGRYSFRQYIRDKPTKWGMKLWVIADPETGYTYNFDVYLGKDTGMQGDGGLAYNVVMKLVKRLAGKGYRIFFDNFYTTVKLLKDLFMIGIGACGTILSNRRGFPTELKNVKEFEKGSKRGDYRWSRDEEVLTVQWRDNKTISVMSTFHEANSTVKVTRRTKVDNKFERIEVKQPIAIKDYNKYMGGVDRSDQLINKYHGLRKTNKFWKTLFLHMIDISRVNSYILFNDWRSKNKDVLELRRPNRYTQLDFTEELIRDLAKIALYAQVPVASMHIYHVCQSIIPVVSAKRRNCKLCYDKYQQEKKTNVKCDGCGVHLCFVKKRNCLLAYHTR